ncbi:MAG: DISARM system SNF2-like helicase DrmD, partial [Actinomycetota bacterium]|nr:DISARM system SNF2-like helicase DrmD [Actinomycetota bacterium]
MIPQWQDELEARFGLTFEVLDRDYVARVRQERGYGVNPWDTHSRFLVSQRLLIDETYTTPLRNWLGELKPGSLLILDEAHHAAPASGAKYAIDSKITRAVRDLAQRFEHRLFLSATPHNGHSNSFSALLEILDPQRFCRGVPVRGRKLLEDVMVRRLKEDVREVAGGFPKRTVVQVDIDGLPETAPELVLSELLDEYRQTMESRLSGASRRQQTSAGLLVSGLQQRLLSSVEAFARTLRVHKRTVEKHAAEGGKPAPVPVSPARDLELVAAPVGADDDGATLTEEELQQEEESQIEAAAEATAVPLTDAAVRALFAKEQELLERMTQVVEQARWSPDARIKKLVDWVRKNMCPGLPGLGESIRGGPPPQWNDTRVIIFTEWEDTRRYLAQQLSAAINGTDRAEERIEVYTGSTPRDRREEIKRAFNADPARHPVRLLIATDAAREGLNLQTHCWNLFHFDVPWNPARMEQRNGRIDRKLQPKDEVFCHYFVYKQRVEDRVLQVLVRKTETIKKELGSLSQVIEGQLAATLQYGIRHDRAAAMERDISEADLERDKRRTVEEELEESRERQNELREEIERLRTRLEESRKHIGLEESHFREAITASLELAGAAGIASLPGNGNGDSTLQRWSFPALDQRQGADPTWVDTMDTLRTPRGRDQKLWEWRRDCQPRPVVFEDPGTIDDTVVHLHLEHRVVQRLLGRFTAQGFVHHDLSRACLAQTTDAIPRVILMGRLALYGPGAARLHEELIAVAARWVEPSLRKGPLTPYSREAEEKTLDLLEQAMLSSSRHAVPKVPRDHLEAAVAQDIAELLPRMEEKGRGLAKDAEAKLHERGTREALAMHEILAAQQRRVQATIDKNWEAPLQGLEADEIRQYEANRRHWTRRIEAIDRELQSEPARIRDTYQIKATRIDPVGLVYLWPVTG